VDVQDEVALLRGEEQVLAAAPRAGEPQALERRERRVERLQRRDVRRAGLLDRRAPYSLVQSAARRLDLGKLGNSSSSWTRSA
jgi:hypothetical protein